MQLVYKQCRCHQNPNNKIAKSKLPGELRNKIQHKNTRYKENPRKRSEYKNRYQENPEIQKEYKKSRNQEKKKIYEAGNSQ